jgi:hypothetical protein
VPFKKNFTVLRCINQKFSFVKMSSKIEKDDKRTLQCKGFLNNKRIYEKHSQEKTWEQTNRDNGIK